MATAESESMTGKLPLGLDRSWRWAIALPRNPVLVRDIRSMFRGRRVPTIQLAYLVALMAAMAVASLALYQNRMGYGGWGRVASLADFGRWMFIGLAETQVVVILLTVVAYSAAAISLEREKQTYDVLAITRMTSAEVVVGKVASIATFCYLLMLTSAPLAAFCLFFGGVSPSEIAVTYGMLAIKVPLWASIGVLASILSGRSVPAYVATLVAVAGENVLAVLLMEPYHSPAVCMGLFSPLVAPLAEGVDFALLGQPIPSWLLPIPYAALLTALAMVGCAEAMLHYRPKRSPLVRGLLLGTTLYMAFLLMAIVVNGSRQSPGGQLPVTNVLLAAWAWACVFVPVSTSYPPNPDNGGPRRLDRAATDPNRWLERDAATGGGFCLLMWLTGLAGAAAAISVALVKLHSQVKVPAELTTTPALCLSLVIYALSIMAYSAWGTVLAIVNKARREVALATMLFILFMNVGAAYVFGVDITRRSPRVAPVVLASPAAAASTVLSQSRGHSLWGRYTLEEGFAYGIGYPLLLLGGAYWYYTRHCGKRGLEEKQDPDDEPLPGNS